MVGRLHNNFWIVPLQVTCSFQGGTVSALFFQVCWCWSLWLAENLHAASSETDHEFHDEKEHHLPSLSPWIFWCPAIKLSFLEEKPPAPPLAKATFITKGIHGPVLNIQMEVSSGMNATLIKHGFTSSPKRFLLGFVDFGGCLSILGTKPNHKYVSKNLCFLTDHGITQKNDPRKKRKKTPPQTFWLISKKTTTKKVPPLQTQFHNHFMMVFHRSSVSKTKVQGWPNDTTWVLESSYQIKQWWDHYLNRKDPKWSIFFFMSFFWDELTVFLFDHDYIVRSKVDVCIG